MEVPFHFPELMKSLIPVVFIALRVLGSSALGAELQPRIEWSTIDGGGDRARGRSSSASYTLVGTVGQPDANTVTMVQRGLVEAGDPAAVEFGVVPQSAYTLCGGFWPGALKQPLFPPLSIRRDGSSTIILSWPRSALTFSVIGGTNLVRRKDDGWAPVIGEAVVVGDHYEMNLRVTGAVRFFQLVPEGL